MNSKIYRCGWCGNPTTVDGSELEQSKWERVVSIIEKYNDSHTTKTNGYCCPNGDGIMMQVTREMAIDAGDRSLEGQWIKW